MTLKKSCLDLFLVWCFFLGCRAQHAIRGWTRDGTARREKEKRGKRPKEKSSCSSALRSLGSEFDRPVKGKEKNPVFFLGVVLGFRANRMVPGPFRGAAVWSVKGHSPDTRDDGLYCCWQGHWALLVLEAQHWGFVHKMGTHTSGLVDDGEHRHRHVHRHSSGCRGKGETTHAYMHTHNANSHFEIHLDFC
ncbi:hypothetical protein CKAH01_13028 [Colletotrichum kahawae]|uniref:Secreted protein n=1 Tax=Colletotrichum kahawae TaxID=34407 RepID=A0AAD9YPA2_COLKA|nr:hypothetical protein CKAH01_13028 [Colletotrichum kahawae]